MRLQQALVSRVGTPLPGLFSFVTGSNYHPYFFEIRCPRLTSPGPEPAPSLFGFMGEKVGKLRGSQEEEGGPGCFRPSRGSALRSHQGRDITSGECPQPANKDQREGREGWWHKECRVSTKPPPCVTAMATLLPAEGTVRKHVSLAPAAPEKAAVGPGAREPGRASGSGCPPWDGGFPGPGTQPWARSHFPLGKALAPSGRQGPQHLWGPAASPQEWPRSQGLYFPLQRPVEERAVRSGASVVSDEHPEPGIGGNPETSLHRRGNRTSLAKSSQLPGGTANLKAASCIPAPSTPRATKERPRRWAAPEPVRGAVLG